MPIAASPYIPAKVIKLTNTLAPPVSFDRKIYKNEMTRRKSNNMFFHGLDPYYQKFLADALAKL